ncbi:hypothetical protein [Nannocystis pusilla]|uniref:hypothetical protein n=1 Tax=Nannocystis pusilla TaxID=889268 RepID=UPI003B829BA7
MGQGRLAVLERAALAQPSPVVGGDRECGHPRDAIAARRRVVGACTRAVTRVLQNMSRRTFDSRAGMGAAALRERL